MTEFTQTRPIFCDAQVAYTNMASGVQVAYVSTESDLQGGYGATAARLTPDQKVGSSNLSGLTFPIA